MDSETLREVLQDAAREIDRHSDDNIAINRIVESVVTKVTGSESSSVWMNEYPKLIREREEGVRELSMEEKRGLLYKCFLTKQPAFYNYITSEKGYIPEIDNPDSIRIKSKITIPLSVQDRLIGIVTCYSSVKKIKNYTREDLERFKAITPFVIDAIIRMQANRGNQVIEERRQGRVEDTGQRRRNRIIEKIETLEEQSRETSDASEILEMTSTIVHDIRTPANNLMGFLEILDEQIGDKRLKEYIEHAKKSAALINDLTTSILDSMAERRIREQSRVERVNTLKFFAEVGEIFSATMYEKGLQYNIFIDPRLPKEIALETMKLKRVLMNLLGNAVKFTPENGVIEFSVEYLPETKRLLCTVKDSGIGIPEERQAEIFKPFTQAEDSTRVRFGGSGLGLSVSSEFVREMGGELHLKSQPDRGSLFYFELPLKDQEKRPQLEPFSDESLEIGILYTPDKLSTVRNLIRYLVAFGIDANRIKAIKSPEAVESTLTHLLLFEHFLDEDLLRQSNEKRIASLVVEENFLSLEADRIFGAAGIISRYDFYGEKLYAFVAPKRPLKVLIVEDDRISVELVRTMLEEEYCEIDVAYSGEEGLKLLEEAASTGTPYDLLFSDHSMPGLSGDEMIRRYREKERNEGIRRLQTVSISGDPDRGGSDGIFDHYAGKPFNKSEIVGVVQALQNQSKE